MESNGKRLEFACGSDGVAPLDVQRGAAPAPPEPCPALLPQTGVSRAVGSRPTLPLPHPSAWFCACRAPKSNPDEGPLLYTLPDDSACQLLQPQQDCHHLRGQPAATGQPGTRRVPQGPGLEATWDPLSHPGKC